MHSGAHEQLTSRLPHSLLVRDIALPESSSQIWRSSVLTLSSFLLITLTSLASQAQTRSSGRMKSRSSCLKSCNQRQRISLLSFPDLCGMLEAPLSCRYEFH